jgi:hypothetical protein
VYSLAGVGLVALAVVILVLGVIALRQCDPEDIPDALRALSRFVGHPDHRPPGPPVRRPARERRRLGAGTGPPRRQDSRRPASARTAVRRRQRRRAKR